MYVDWTDGGSYDFVIVDWYCETVANNTYWAVHNWSGGYAGFQYSGGQYKNIATEEPKEREEKKKMVYNVHRNQNYKWKNLLCAMGS